MLPSHLKPVHLKPMYSSEQIDQATSRIAKEISSWAESVWQDSHTDLLTIPVLRGAIFFYADLVKKITHSVEIAPARTWAYEKDQNGVEKDSVKVSLEHVPAKGRAVLLVDDICDSGRTLHVLKQALLDVGARYVKSCVLIKRELEDQTFEPDWVGFNYSGPEWMVGYGMDDGDRWRNLPDIYVIKQTDTKNTA